jgi:hypothetical protein
MLYGLEYWPTKRWHVQQLSVADMRMLRWICGHRRRDRVRNDDIRERLGVEPVEKLVQHRLRCGLDIQWRPLEAPVHRRVISRTGMEREVEEDQPWHGRSLRRDLKDWSITKELALDSREWKLAIHVLKPWYSVPTLLLLFFFLFALCRLYLFQFFMVFPPFYVYFIIIVLPSPSSSFSPLFLSLLFGFYGFHR